MPIIEINTTGVVWPMTPSVKEAMHRTIRNTAKDQGYGYFMTRSFRCLNGIESPDFDPPAPEGWVQVDFFSDAEAEKVADETAVFRDLVLYARK